MFVQIKFFVGFVATQSTQIFFGNVIHRGFVHSFLVSSQIAFRCGIIDAWNLSGFDVTVKLLVFNMYVLNVESKLLFPLKLLSQLLQGDSTSLWTAELWSLSAFLAMNCFPHMLQTKSAVIFVKCVAFCSFLGD